VGYHMELMDQSIFIPKENKEFALQAIKNLVGKETIVDSGGPHFAWVSTDGFLRAKTLQEAMCEWRWDISEDEDGNVDYISFGGEKSGDDEILFRAIAMYVKPGSFIEMQGEDGYRWRWVFDGDTCKEKSGKIVWED
jgi:hypothetical protein